MKRYVTPASVIATVALFVALGGSSLAAANYIDGASIKPNSIPANRLTQAAVVELRSSRIPASAVDSTFISGLQAHSEPSKAPAEFKAGMPNTLQSANAYCAQPFGTEHGGDVLTGGGFVFEPNGADQAKFVLTASQAALISGKPTTQDQPWEWRISGFYRDANAKDPPLLVHVIAMCLRGR